MNEKCRRDIQAFTTSLHYAEEYALDAFALKNSKNPYSYAQYLLWANNGADTSVDTPHHPSIEKRIKRMRYMHEHGKPPPDEYLRTAADWQERIQQRTSEPDRSP